MAKKEETAAAAAAKFTPAQLVKSKRFTTIEKSIINAVLGKGGLYTVAEAKAAIVKFMKKEVV